MILALASYEIAPWLPGLVVWWSKPWLDRTILFVLSRAAFGTPPRRPMCGARSARSGGGSFRSRGRCGGCPPWRSLTEPIYQLEGFSIFKARPRIKQIRRPVWDPR
jgi:hypothetical protein